MPATTAVPQLKVPFPQDEVENDAIDFSSMKSAELDAFADDHEIEISGWSKMKVGDKKKALAAAFGQFLPTSGVEDGNTIEETIAEIAKIETEEAALAEIANTFDNSNFSKFRIGGILSHMQANGWHGEAADTYALVEERVGMKQRSQQYAMAMYQKVVTLEIPWTLISKVGWSKFREIHTVLTDENYENLLTQVVDLNHAEVIQFVKDYKANEATDPSDTKKITRLAFAVHDDDKVNIQKMLAKAKEDSGTEFDGVALGYVALDFLAGGAKPVEKKPATVKQVMQGMFKAAANSPAKKREALMSILVALNAVVPDLIDVEEFDASEVFPD
jgi:hypothetical protein